MKLQKFRAGFGRVVKGIGYLGLLCLFVMVIVVAVDVILRKASGSYVRINGSNEVVAFSMVVLCSLWIPVLQLKKGHVMVPLFVDKFPYRFRCFWLFAIALVETALIAMLALGAYYKILADLKSARLTDVLKMPWWIFAIVVAVAFVEYFIISLIDTIQLFADGVKNKPQTPAEAGWSEDEVKGL